MVNISLNILEFNLFKWA